MKLGVCVCSVTLDTPMNRKNMPDADFSAWTPLPDLAKYVCFHVMSS